MKWLFFVFLVANALVFAVIQFGGPGSVVDPRGREINASQVHIVTGQLAGPRKASEASGVASAPAEIASAIAASSAASVQAEMAGKPGTVCLRWSGITLDVAEQARSRIKALNLTATESGGSESARVWVYIPPLDTLEDARKKAIQIAELGVEDYFVVNNGSKWQFSISLGVFSTREAAERRLADLKAKGVRSAVLRDKEDSLKPVTFTLKNVAAENKQKLEKAGGQIRGAELHEIACK